MKVFDLYILFIFLELTDEILKSIFPPLSSSFLIKVAKGLSLIISFLLNLNLLDIDLFLFSSFIFSLISIISYFFPLYEFFFLILFFLFFNFYIGK